MGKGWGVAEGGIEELLAEAGFDLGKGLGGLGEMNGFLEVVFLGDGDPVP